MSADLPIVVCRVIAAGARQDLGLPAGGRWVPVGTLFADAFRCRVMTWCELEEDQAVADQVARLGHTMADLIEGADRAG